MWLVNRLLPTTTTRKRSKTTTRPSRASGSSIRLEVVRGSFTPLDEAVRRFGAKPNRVIPTLVAAGCTIKLEHAETVPYLRQVLECGGFAQYERTHRRRLAWILGRGTRVPAEIAADDHRPLGPRRLVRRAQFRGPGPKASGPIIGL